MANEKASVLFESPVLPFSIGEIEFDLLSRSEIKYDTEVTESPTELGFIVADHTIQRPMKIVATALITATPVTWNERFGGASADRLPSTLKKLEELWKKKEPIILVMSDEIYENMVVTSISIPKESSSTMLYVGLEFTQILIVTNELTDIPAEYVDALDAGKAGISKQEGGEAETSTVASGSAEEEATEDTIAKTEVKKSTLYSILKE